MNIRLAILLSGSLAVSAAGGGVVLASLESSRDEVRRRLAELELLAEMMAASAGRPVRVSQHGQEGIPAR